MGRGFHWEKFSLGGNFHRGQFSGRKCSGGNFHRGELDKKLGTSKKIEKKTIILHTKWWKVLENSGFYQFA